MDEVEVVEAVMNQDLFAGISYDQIETIYRAASRRRLKPRAVLCEPLTIDDHLYILLDGQLRLETPDGVKLDDLDPVRTVGEMGVLMEQARTSRVVASRPSEILAISREELQALADADPDLGTLLLANLCKTLYSRVHEMNEDIEALRRQVEALRQRLQELAPEDPLLAEVAA